MKSHRTAHKIYTACAFCGGLVFGATLIAGVMFATLGAWGEAVICLAAFIGMMLVIFDTKG